jgi:hypothetical protein
MRDEDPRTTSEHIRRITATGEESSVVLIGVVHDHPASKHRVRTVLRDVKPEVLALELPPIAVPLYERYAADEHAPTSCGGEMSVAVESAGTDRVEGIDGPTPAFLRGLLGKLYRDGTSLSTVRRVISGLASITRRAVACRVGATVMAFTPVHPDVDRRVEHDCDWTDAPAEQAVDERKQIRRTKAARSVLARSDVTHVRDATREEHMACRLSTLRTEGTTVAVVGIDHLDAVASRLKGGQADC